MAEWIDATSYSRSERGNREPTAWRIDCARGVTVVVTKAHRANPGFWVMHCAALGIDTEPLGMPAKMPSRAAQQNALVFALREAQRITDALRKEAFAFRTFEPAAAGDVKEPTT